MTHELVPGDVSGTAAAGEEVAVLVIRPLELCHHAQTWRTVTEHVSDGEHSMQVGDESHLISSKIY